MYMTFENEYGVLTFHGDGSGLWNLTSAVGLGMATKEFKTVRYTGEDGQARTSSSVLPRAITLSGDIKRYLNIKSELEKAVRILNREGILKIYNVHKRRKIKCVCEEFDLTERNGGFQKFVLQFVADYPYFEDFNITTTPIFKREKLVTLPFTVGEGILFTKRTNEATITNKGIANCEPIITIVNNSGTSAPGNSSITVENTTTGQHIILNYAIQNDETIVIDIKERKINSNKPTEANNNGNLINYMSDDTFLSDFWLTPGDNLITATHSGINLAMFVEHNNLYGEAVY